MKEADARAALRAFVAAGADQLEAWIAAQRWEATADGWAVAGELEDWRFRVKIAPGGLRVSASLGEGGPAEWFVPGRPAPAS
jgi:hypothetical protein